MRPVVSETIAGHVPQHVRPSDLYKELGVVRDLAWSVIRAPSLWGASIGAQRPVLVLPGFRCDDRATSVIRAYLRRRGFDPQGWDLGVNRGNVNSLLPKLGDLTDRLAQRAGQPVGLVGWSLGGYLAREIARDHPQAVHRVVTLGSPVVGGPKYTLAARHYIRAKIDLDDIEAQVAARYQRRLETPVTAIYSRDDGVVHWTACIDRVSPRVEHVPIRCSHIGFAFHADALRITSDRLARASEDSTEPMESRPPATVPPGTGVRLGPT